MFPQRHRSALREADCTLDDVIRVHYYLTDAACFEHLAPIFGQYFAKARPAATAIICGLVDARMKIEIEVTARIPMPVTIFAMLVFGICALLGAGLVEVVMRNFAGEAGVPTWVFVIAPALLSMLFALLLYRKAVSNVSGIKQSLSRALLVAILTLACARRLHQRSMVPGVSRIGLRARRRHRPHRDRRRSVAACCVDRWHYRWDRIEATRRLAHLQRCGAQSSGMKRDAN